MDCWLDINRAIMNMIKSFYSQGGFSKKSYVINVLWDFCRFKKNVKHIDWYDVMSHFLSEKVNGELVHMFISKQISIYY